jgi:hypothetical protein
LNHNESGLLAGNYEEKNMSLGTILLIVLILMLIGVIPTWPHSRSWGYWPSGALGVVVSSRWSGGLRLRLDAWLSSDRRLGGRAIL